MSLVMRSLKALAIEFNCAVLVVHHTRKNAEAGAADAISGAASIVNLARRAIMPVTLSKEEAIEMGILPSERLRYIKLVDAKSNLVPRSADPTLYRLHGIDLPNEEPPVYPFGDNVQAVTRVQLSIQNRGMATDQQKIRQAIVDLVDRGKAIEGRFYPYSPSAAGADNSRALLSDAIAAAQAATAPRQYSAGDLEALVKRAIKDLHREGVLVSRPVKDLVQDAGKFRKAQGLKVDRSRMPDGGPDATGTKSAA
jgi:hypothetical protein